VILLYTAYRIGKVNTVASKAFQPLGQYLRNKNKESI